MNCNYNSEGNDTIRRLGVLSRNQGKPPTTKKSFTERERQTEISYRVGCSAFDLFGHPLIRVRERERQRETESEEI